MKFYIYTLGCKVNMYESEVMRDILENYGYRQGTATEADICIINTCTVTNTADQKSMKMIRQAIRKNPRATIVVAGCMSERNPRQAHIEGVDIILGNRGKSEIIALLEEHKKKRQPLERVTPLADAPFETMRLNNFLHTRAFVKIEDGCENYCSYCIIPYTRGKVRSKPPEEVIEEIRDLVHNGHCEIVLTGIHTGHYGADLGIFLADLLADIVQTEGLKRLRISSIEITEINDRMLRLLKKYPVIVDHLHIPLQSGCDSTLKAMNRKYDIAYFQNKIKEIRTIRPHISLTTDVIVGFPGETEENFAETLANIERMNFSKIHVFPFSKRDGTVAADMDNQISETVKRDRVHRLLQLSRDLEEHYMEKFIGETVSFLPETFKDGFLIGHTGNYLLVKSRGDKELLHRTIPVKLTDIAYPYILGTLTNEGKNSIVK